MVEVADRTHQGLGILVNNAGGGGHVEPVFPAASPLQWGTQLATSDTPRPGFPLVNGSVVRLPGQHGKIRRDRYGSD